MILNGTLPLRLRVSVPWQRSVIGKNTHFAPGCNPPSKSHVTHLVFVLISRKLLGVPEENVRLNTNVRSVSHQTMANVGAQKSKVVTIASAGPAAKI